MYIAKNLQALRKRDKITQEDLADQLNVSRQSVSKWETGEAYPETDKLLALCDLFDVSLDALLRSDLAESATDEREKATDVKTFSAHMNKFSRGISLGVLLVLSGVAVCVAFAGIADGRTGKVADLWGVMGGVAVLAFVAVAVFLFVWHGAEHDRFRKAHPVINEKETLPPDDTFGLRMALSVSGILADVVFLIVFCALLDTGVIAVAHKDAAMCFVTAAFLAILGGLVSGLTLMGIRRSTCDIAAYNAQTQEELHPSPRRKLSDALCGAIMMTATALFLVLGFVWDLWHPGWVVFPVGGILCGIVSSLTRRK